MKYFVILLLANALLAPQNSIAQALTAETNLEGVKQQAWQRVKWAETNFAQSGARRQPSPNFWGDQIVYQIQVDRFNNGDPRNDFLNVKPEQRENRMSVFEFRHGGDLRGILERLDYIKDLGINSLWLTPVFAHDGGYHGYCTTDFSMVDPGFGTNEEFRNLVAEAHKRGMMVVLDIVVNHMCNPRTRYSRQANHYECADSQNAKNWSGQGGPSPGQGELQFSQDFFGPLKNQNFFNRCGTNSTGDMQGTGPAAIYGDFVDGMFDFDTRNYDFQQIFTDLHKYWIAYADVDGFRMDAVKHVSEDFIAYFSTEVRDYARSIGKHNFFIVGEVAGPSDWIGRRLGNMYHNPANPNQHGHVPVSLTKRIMQLKPMYEKNPAARFPGLNAAYDFAHGGSAIDVLHNYRPSSVIEGHFSDSYYNDIAGNGDPRLSWNPLEIHDWPRFASRNPGAMAKSILGIAYLAFAEGSPIIYYGMEQGFNGVCQGGSCPGHSDALFRQDMFMGGMTRLGSTVPEINSLASISGGNPSMKFRIDQDPFLNRNHELYKSARKFLRIRGSCDGLREGYTQFRWKENGNEGILAFFRVHPQDRNKHVLVVLNTAWQSRTVPNLHSLGGMSGTTWRNLLNPAEAVSDNGSIQFNGMNIGANSVMVFVPESAMGPYNGDLQTNLCR